MWTGLLVAYILGAVFVGGIMGIGLWKVGGFRAYTEMTNELLNQKREVHYVEWMVLLAILLWPVLIYLFLTQKRAR